MKKFGRVVLIVVVVLVIIFGPIWLLQGNDFFLTSGMVCVLAHDLEEAEALIRKKYDDWADMLPIDKLKIVTEPEAFADYKEG